MTADASTSCTHYHGMIEPVGEKLAWKAHGRALARVIESSRLGELYTAIARPKISCVDKRQLSGGSRMTVGANVVSPRRLLSRLRYTIDLNDPEHFIFVDRQGFALLPTRWQFTTATE
jgi:hypothetical protein